MESKIITLFEKVQKIPYKVCKFNEEEIDENIKYGDCRHKSTLLYNLLQKEGFEVNKLGVIFDWKDLPIPDNILSILKNSGTIWTHYSLSAKIRDNWIKVDCTWDPPLKKLGFPVTIKWNGLVDTKQVTEGKLRFYEVKDYSGDSKRIKIIKEEAYSFADALNKWIQKSR